MIQSDPRPIGVFDSGVGGLSVLSQLIQSFPSESFVYLGDTARLPYGSKSPQTITHYVNQNINYLIKKQNVKAIIVACNSASTVLDHIVPHPQIPIFGVIKPGAKSAQNVTRNKKIAIWATRATVSQNSYKKALLDLDPQIETYSVTCPLLVPLVEEGLWEGPITEAIVDLYLNELKNTFVDTLILGCTHYPFIRSTIEKRIAFYSQKDSSFFANKAHDHFHIVDSALAICDELQEAFDKKTLTKSNTDQNLSLLLTDEASHFMNLVLKSFPHWKNIDFQVVDI